MLNPSEGIALFSDGSCWTGDRIGGWAFVAIDAFSGEFKWSGYEYDTTISRMELWAIYEGLVMVHDECGPCKIIVYSDSLYAVDGATDKTRKRSKNKLYWDRLDEAEALHTQVVFTHVRGHSDSHYNHLADKLAGKARKEGQKDAS